MGLEACVKSNPTEAEKRECRKFIDIFESIRAMFAIRFFPPVPDPVGPVSAVENLGQLINQNNWSGQFHRRSAVFKSNSYSQSLADSLNAETILNAVSGKTASNLPTIKELQESGVYLEAAKSFHKDLVAAAEAIEKEIHNLESDCS